MSTKEKDVISIIPMSDVYVDDVIAVYNKLRAVRSVDTKYRRPTVDQDILTEEQITSTNLGGSLDLSFIYKVNDNVVGFIWGRLAYVGIPVQLVGFIHMIIVDPDLQRKGVARELINAVALRCGEEGVDTIRTVVGERDWDLSNFLSEVGFQDSGLVIYTRTVQS
ncbi:MAG: GNAT family N-acetyltransferase [Dehalococcoidales bacterium]|nr:MAG: GNAT family N-acetyltransferase [Dehalococcoidales bacterium]